MVAMDANWMEFIGTVSQSPNDTSGITRCLFIAVVYRLIL
jgi:hypothetical protein